MLSNTPQAVTAMFANQAEWLVRNVSGNVLWADDCVAHQPGALVAAGSQGVAIVHPHPDAIDKGLTWLRGAGSSDVLIWSATEQPAADIHLTARGGRDSFRPHWMRRTLGDPLPVPRVEADVEIAIATQRDGEALDAARDVPYISSPQIGRILDLATAPDEPRRVWLLIARRKRRFGETSVAGIGILHLSDYRGEIVGGLYNLGVDPAWRGQGIGAALTVETCRIARDHGAASIALNATPDGERVYRQLDFTVIGDGQTWFLPAGVLRDPPTVQASAAAEALANGRIDTLDAGIARWPGMPNGESPLRYAARYRQREAVAWLLGHGAEPEIMPLWELGFRDEAVRAAGDDRWLNVQRGPEARTPLHEAICANDAGLVRMLLAAGPDLTIRDSQWHGTPLDWAKAMGHPELAELIQEAM